MGWFSPKKKRGQAEQRRESAVNHVAHLEELENRLVPVSYAIPGSEIAGPTFEDTGAFFPPNPEGAASNQYLVSVVNNIIQWNLRPEFDDPTNPFDQLPIQIPIPTFFGGTSVGPLIVQTTGGVTFDLEDGDYRAPTSVPRDAHVIYDHIFDRFLVAAAESNGTDTSTLYVAVSATDNPFDGWYFRSIGTEHQASVEFFGRDADGNLVNPQQFYTEGVRLGLTRNDVILTTTAIQNIGDDLEADAIRDSLIFGISKPFFYENIPAQSQLTVFRFRTPDRDDPFVYQNPFPAAVAIDEEFNLLPSQIIQGAVIANAEAYLPDGPLLPGGATRTINYEITAGNDPQVVTINPTTGVITVFDPQALLDAGTVSLTVQVSVIGYTTALVFDTLTTTATITINIAANQNPQARNATFNLDVTPPPVAGTAVGIVPAWDPDVQQISQLVYSITGGNTGDTFAINNAGLITVANPLLLVPAATFTLTINVADPSGGTATSTVTINAVGTLPVSQPSIFAATFSIPATTPIGGLAAVAPAYDPENQALTYTIAAGNTNGAFAINPGTGQITVANPAAFQAQGTFNLLVNVTDGGPPVGAVITINVLNSAPIVGVLPDSNPTPGAPIEMNVRQSAFSGTIVGTVPAYDPDGQPITNFQITAGNTNNAFAINAATGQITVNNNPGMLLDFYVLTIQVSDGIVTGSGTVFITTNSFFLGLVPVHNFGIDNDSAFFVDFTAINRPGYNAFYNSDFDIRGNLFRWDINAPPFGTFRFPQYFPLLPGVISPGFRTPALEANAPWLPEFGTIPVDPIGQDPIELVLSDTFVQEMIRGGGQTPTSAVFRQPPANPNGGVGRLWTANTMVNNATDLATARWYEFEVAVAIQNAIGPDFFLGATGGAPLQQGSVNTVGLQTGGLPLHTYAPGIMIDRFNNMAIAFAGSNANTLISAYYSGRFDEDRANPAWNGITRPSKLLAAGEDLYARGIQFALWGRGSGLALDPINDDTFWTFNSYAKTRPPGNVFGSWATTWGHFILVPDQQVFVIDVSASMNVVKNQDVNGSGFSDSADDLNGDGLDGTLLDLAIGQIMQLYWNSLLPGMAGDPGEVGIIIFGGNAKPVALDIDDTGNGIYFVNPLLDNNGSGESDFLEALEGIRQGLSQFIFKTEVDSSRTAYAPALVEIGIAANFFPLQVFQAAMYSDGSGRLPTLFGISPDLYPRIDATALGPYSFVGPIQDYQRIPNETNGTFTQINRPASNTVDGGYAPTVRVPGPVVTGSIAAGTIIRFDDGTVVEVTTTGQVIVTPPNPAIPSTEDDTSNSNPANGPVANNNSANRSLSVSGSNANNQNTRTRDGAGGTADPAAVDAALEEPII